MTLWRKAGEQFFSNNGKPLAGGYFQYQLANTNTDATVYKDSALTVSHALSVTLDSSGRLVDPIYWGTSDLKELLYTSDGELIFSEDEYPANGGGGGASTTFYRPASLVQSEKTIVASDNGNTFVLDTSGGAFNVELPDLADVEHGFHVEFIYQGVELYRPTWSAFLGDNVDFGYGNATSGTLTKIGQKVLFISGGDKWRAQIEEAWASDVVGLTATVSASALTVTLTHADGTAVSPANPLRIKVKKNSTTGPDVDVLISSALSVTVPSTATLGVAANEPFRVHVCVVNTGTDGVPVYKLAVFQSRSGVTVTALGATGYAAFSIANTSADSAGILYANTSATGNGGYGWVGVLEWTSGLATPGTWSAAPDNIFTNQEVGLPGRSIKKQAFLTTSRIVLAYAGSVFTADSTTPQKTEGGEVMSHSFTPNSNASLLEITSVINVKASASLTVNFAVFGDGSNALLAWGGSVLTNEFAPMSMVGRVLANTVSSNISVRFSHGSGTEFAYINGDGDAGAAFGTATVSCLLAEEIAT